MRISARDGSPCGKFNLHALVDGADLEGGKYALSYHDTMIFSERDEDLSSVLSLGEARATIQWTMWHSGRRQYTVTIESPNVPDFIALRREVARRLGWMIEDITYPSVPIPPNQQSFVRGVINDVRRLYCFIIASIAAMRRKIGWRIISSR